MKKNKVLFSLCHYLCKQKLDQKDKKHLSISIVPPGLKSLEHWTFVQLPGRTQSTCGHLGTWCCHKSATVLNVDYVTSSIILTSSMYLIWVRQLELPPISCPVYTWLTAAVCQKLQEKLPQLNRTTSCCNIKRGIRNKWISDITS